MIPEDKLSRDERIRLESIAQANQYLMMGVPKKDGALFLLADQIEEYIRHGLHPYSKPIP